MDKQYPALSICHQIKSWRSKPVTRMVWCICDSLDASCKLHILGHDRHAFGMNGTKICVIEYPNKVSLRGLL